MNEFTKAYHRTKQTVWNNLMWPLLATIGFIAALIMFVIVMAVIIKCLFVYPAQTIVLLVGLIVIGVIGYSIHTFCNNVREIRREDARHLRQTREAEQLGHF